MSDQTTPTRPFFQPRAECDDLQTAYLLRKIAERVEAHDSGCWEWTGRDAPGGYGIIEVGGRKQRVHRLVYTFCVAPVPSGLMVLHQCDNPPCCNPAHLFVGDAGINNRDCVAKGRHPELRVNDVQALEIRQRAREGKRGIYRQLAEEFGMSMTAIGRIARGEGRFHLPPVSPVVFTDTDRSAVAEFIRSFRQSNGLRQKDVADLLGFATSYISRVESGKRVPCDALIFAVEALKGGGT